MNDAVKFLSENTTGILATIGIDGKPKVRPFTFFFEKEGKLWFETSNDKSVYKELITSPNLEFCVLGKKMSWIRLSGEAVFIDDREDIKVAMFKKAKNLTFLYQNPQNPVFEIFHLKNAKAVLHQYGSEPREFVFSS